MGLDNGLILHTREPIEIPVEIWADFSIEDEPLKYSYELLYFRKCWNVRREIVQALNASYEYCGKAWLTIDEVKKIWWAINEVNHKSVWDRGDRRQRTLPDRAGADTLLYFVPVLVTRTALTR